MIDLFLDSGAYSADVKGIEIDIHEYIEFIKLHERSIDLYANLDVIGDAEATLKNQKIMEKAGLSPLPTYHVNEDFKYLDYYIKNYDYMALGGLVGTSQPEAWLDRCFDRICDKEGYPKLKVHGFGITKVSTMVRYPWYSVDSTSWVMTSRMGSVFIPQIVKGEPDYTKTPWKVVVSNKSPSKTEKGWHIDTMSPMKKEKVLHYLGSKGFELGTSKYYQVAKDYKPNKEDNERWFDKERLTVEKVLKPGLQNSYIYRDEANIIYFCDLEKAQPEWPWPFKRSKRGGRGLLI